MENNRHILEADGIHFARRGRDILSSIYFRLEEGEIVGIFGRNGCGKSTFLQIVFGSLFTENASIRINQTKINRGFESKIPIRYLPQFHFLPRNLCIKQILSQYGISDEILIYDFPELKQFLDRKIVLLSGGLQRVLEIYLILMGQQRGFVLLDEPFTFLSPIFIEKFQAIFQRESSQKGIVLTDHQIQPVFEITSKHYFMRNGRITLLSQNDNLLDQYYI